MQRQQAVRHHVGDQHSGDTQRKPGVRGDLRQRLRPALADSGDAVLVMPGEPGLRNRSRSRREYRLKGDVLARFGTAASDRVRPDQRTTRILSARG